MADSKPHSDNDVKAPNIFKRAEEEVEAVLNSDLLHLHHNKETHGLRNDIDENTPLNDVKAPNVFERAKEEIEAVVQTVRTKIEPENGDEKREHSTKAESKLGKEENDAKAPNLIERAKEEIEAMIHHDKPLHHHHKETHGRSDDIDESTPVDEVKAPNVFERAKEEIEAVVQTIHPKKESEENSSDVVSSPKKEGGFGASIGRGLEKICSPLGKGMEKFCSPHDSKRD